MNISKKVIVDKTALFIKIILFVIAFKLIFGDENVLIGVTTVTAMLMFMQQDLSISWTKNTIKLIILNLFIGLAAFVANQNLWVAIPVNFITTFILAHSLLYDLKNPMYVPYLLQYLFILANPVLIVDLPRRIVALVFGAIAIMVVQFVMNRNKMTNVGNDYLVKSCDLLLEKISLVQQRSSLEGIDESIEVNNEQFRKFLFNKRENDFYLTKEGRFQLNIILAVEKISMSLDEGVKPEQLLLARKYTEIAKGWSQEKNGFEIIKQGFNHLEQSMDCELIYSLTLLYRNIIKLNEVEYKVKEKTEDDIPMVYGITVPLKKRIRKESINFSYGLRMGIGIAIAGFIADFFQLSEGRWILFTVMSLIVPFSEQSVQKARDRIFATLVGVVLVSIVFQFINDTTARVMVMMLAGYIGSYFNQYRYNFIFVTVAATGSAALTSSVEALSIGRIVMVLIGTVIALTLNRYILPNTVKDANANLKRMYQSTIEELGQEVMKYIHGAKNNSVIKSLYLLTYLIEDKIQINNQSLPPEEEEHISEKYKMIISELYDVYVYFGMDQIKRWQGEAWIQKLKMGKV